MLELSRTLRGPGNGGNSGSRGARGDVRPVSQGSAGVAAEITNEGSTSSFASFRGGRCCYSTNARQTSVLRLYVQIFICPVRLKKKTKKKELSNNNNVRVLARMEPWVFNNKKIRSKARWARSPEHSPSRQPVTARRTGRRPEGTWREAGEGAGAARCGPRGPPAPDAQAWSGRRLRT